MSGPTGTGSDLNLGLLSLLLPSLIWVVLVRLRSTVVALWCAGSLLGAASLLGVSLRGRLPNWATFEGAALLAFLGILCTAQALRVNQGTPWPRRWIGGACLLYLLGYTVIRHGVGSVPLRLGFVALAYLILLLEVARWAWRIARRQQSTGAWAIVVAYGLLAVGAVVLLLALALPEGRGPVWHLLSAYHEVFSTVEVVAALAGDVGFIGLALERSVRMAKDAAATQARLEERQALSDQMAHLDRQRGFGLVAASLAHELSQPLTAILASAQAARRGTAANRLDPAQSLELLDKVILNTRRISGLSERIRGFIRPAASRSGPVDLGQITREVLDLMETDLRCQGIRVTAPAEGAPILVRGDALQLSQVVLNVLRNAMEAVKPVQDRSIQIQYSCSASEALLSVRDTGLGLAPGVVDQVGTPYFTTKAEGLGMGLAISIAILQQHQGGLFIGNAEGGGACVDVWLPLLAAGGAVA